MRTLEGEITEILQYAVISQGDNLLGFYYDLKLCLSRETFLENVEVQTTDDPRCLLVATAATTSHLREISDYLVKLWLEQLRYRDFEAHEIFYELQSVTLRFITKANDAPLCVTGKIVITHDEKDE
jgi:hypothetical protein